jgi:type IV secretory pathway VirB4 component
VNDIVTTGISDVIVQNCKTKLFFPNPEASEYDLKHYQELFNLTQSELEYIAGRTKATKGMGRTVLLKKPGESVVLNIDIAPLGSYVKLYKSGSEFINQVTHLKAEKGNQWLESYLQSYAS